MSPKVAVIILKWNGRQDTLECLESVAKIEYANFQITVVDNGSSDGSVGAPVASGVAEVNFKWR